jgi:chemotaxis signal transduction protein
MGDEPCHAAVTDGRGVQDTGQVETEASDRESAAALARHAFSVGGLNLLVSEGTLCEVMEVPAIARVPHTVPWLLGLFNLRGEVVPAFDLARALGLHCGQRPNTKLLVVGRGAAAAGVLVDELPTLQRFAPSERATEHSTLPSTLESSVTDCFTRDGKEWFELSHEQFFKRLAADVALR